MIHNWNDKTVAVVSMVAAVAAITLGLVLGPLVPANGAQSAQGAESTSKAVSTRVYACADPVKRGGCGWVTVTRTARGQAEGERVAHRMRTGSPCKVKYIGWASNPRDNFRPDKRGYLIFSGQSEFHDSRWHVYMVKCPVDERRV